MLCPKCGQNNADAALFCATCGEKLTPAVVSGPQNAPSGPSAISMNPLVPGANRPMPGGPPPMPGNAPPVVPGLGQPQAYMPPPGRPQPLDGSQPPAYSPYGQPQPPQAYQPYSPPPGAPQPLNGPQPGLPPQPSPYGSPPGYGAAPAQAALCRVCGNALTPRDYQCPRCGAPVGTVANPNDPTSSTYMPIGGYRQIENTSGQKSSVPMELQGGWNWGAAFLTLFWVIAHKVWWVLGILVAEYFLSGLTAALGNSDASTVLSTITGIGNLILFIYMGVRGNALAWQYRHFDSVEHCRTVQRTWARWVLILCLIIPASLVLLLMLVVMLSRTS
ncbi:MAG TPA: hypothetical protein VFB38_18685 [Chthonomonadaceae bacterium]|nr:hypothetical protein [Chthonomonadaceae bacterium]